MRLELFKDGSAMFAEKTPMHEVVIEVNGSGYLHIGDRTYPIKNGVAYVGELPQGDYPIRVVSKNKIYHASEHIVETDSGMAYIDDSALWKTLLHLKEKVEKLSIRLAEAEKTIENHEERISGYSLFD